ncbi:MAG TPA: tRNA (guanosine(46)-N7)-methyltransferase TrmB [Micromonosporaceae bacterium]
MTSLDQDRSRAGRPDLGVRHPARVRTFHVRHGRTSGRHLTALNRHWGRYGVTVSQDTPSVWDLTALFGRTAPVVLEIGSGMGETTITMAAADPARDYLAVEVHRPGIANLLELIAAHGLTNVRVAAGDALDLLRHHLAPASLAAMHVFFPDPWPKVRHHKRRLIRPDHVRLIANRLAPGGTLHCATDWADYAGAMLAVLSADPDLANTVAGYAPRPEHRPTTRFERRGVEAGRDIFDLVFRRRP